MSPQPQHEKRLLFIRCLVVLCLVATTIICGYGAFRLTFEFESRLETVQYNSIAKQLQTAIQDNVRSKVLALKSTAALVSMECPTTAHWPNCSVGPLVSYLNITDPIIETINTRTIAFAPIITPAQVSEFEAFAYDFFESNGYPDLGITEDIRGISSVNYSSDDLHRFHDTEGYQEGGHKVLTPVLQIGNLDTNTPAVMFNLYSQAARVSAIDHMIDCFAAGGTECTSITDIIHLVQDPVFRPAVLILHPVTPYHDRGNLTGLTYIVQNWDTVFEGVLPDIVKGIDVVLSGGQNKYTFQINEGRADYKGIGDLHDTGSAHSHISWERFFTLTDFSGSVLYSITIYPTKTFSNQYHTYLPYYVMGLAVFVVLFTSCIFLLYDHLMNSNAVEREGVIETKRLFVRYISHEIRTPLQTVTMGLQLLSSELLACIQQQLLDKSLPPELAATWREQMLNWRSLIEQVEESSVIATNVLNDLINYDKVAMGTLNMELELVSLWLLINTALKPFLVNARQAAVRLVMDSEFELDTDPQHRAALDSLMGVGDAIKISQVVRNLLSNALKFSPQGGVVLVTVRWDPLGLPHAAVPAEHRGSADSTTAGGLVPWSSLARAGSLVLTVRDGGAGMSAEDQKNLFREGIQFNANQLQHGGGSGLGLWIAKGVVELHNGMLSAHSDGEGLGSEFRCELPLVLLPPHDPRTPLPHSPIPTNRHRPPTRVHPDPYTQFSRDNSLASTPTANLALSLALPIATAAPTMSPGGVSRILVVEDSGPTRKVLCRLLKNLGYHAAEAVDGADCVDMMRQQLGQGQGKKRGGMGAGMEMVAELGTGSGTVGGQEQQEAVHMILMDFEMPRMNGPTATKTLRDMGCDLPIVGVTGNVLAEDQQFFLDHGLNYVLRKPLSVELLKETIDKCTGVKWACPNDKRSPSPTGGSGWSWRAGVGAGADSGAGAGAVAREDEHV
ncbi:hypothetical protein B484DRAFT_447076 [Ochromonadaceae sp. CCMP2298]|nr:hypothetical protein B484DRAFT_447076 [Ochromonadaceae sp. CCMP2298]